MIGHCITLVGNPKAQSSYNNLLQSHLDVGNDWTLLPFAAVTPPNAMLTIESLGIVWNFPGEGRSITCPHTGLTLSGYKGAEPLRRIACFASHCLLWKKCMDGGEPIIILEDDAQFVRRLDPDSLLKGGFGQVGLNDPRSATRRAGIYHTACLNAGPDRIIPVPKVDNETVPQGTAGHSAYMIQPWAAKLFLEKARLVGGQPNDTLACYQSFPFLGQLTSYATKVSGRPSQLA